MSSYLKILALLLCKARILALVLCTHTFGSLPKDQMLNNQSDYGILPDCIGSTAVTIDTEKM